MSKYSFEDKCFIEQFVTQNSLDALSTENEEKWQELGNIMNHNWEDIRKMYRNWKIQDDQSHSVSELENNDQIEEQNLHFVIQAESVPEEGLDITECININGQSIRIDELQYLLNDPLPQPINSQIDSFVQSTSSGQTYLSVQSSVEKRSRDVFESEANLDIVQILQRQSDQELDMKKKEHKEKLMVYKQMLIQGEELHKEKMKILRAKLRAIEDQVENIDNAICNRNLKKKFKSDSI